MTISMSLAIEAFGLCAKSEIPDFSQRCREAYDLLCANADGEFVIMAPSIVESEGAGKCGTCKHYPAKMEWCVNEDSDPFGFERICVFWEVRP